MPGENVSTQHLAAHRLEATDYRMECDAIGAYKSSPRPAVRNLIRSRIEFGFISSNFTS